MVHENRIFAITNHKLQHHCWSLLPNDLYNIYDNDGIDSFSIIELIVDIEKNFSINLSEEDFKIEPIKTLYKLSKELPEKEYHKKAVDIWKEFIKKEHYGKNWSDESKDLYYLDLENRRDDYNRIVLKLKVLDSEQIKEEFENPKSLTNSDDRFDFVDILMDFMGDSDFIEIEGFQVALGFKDIEKIG